jgi:hypothetical protein
LGFRGWALANKAATIKSVHHKSTPQPAQESPGKCGQSIRVEVLGKYYPFAVNPAKVPGFGFQGISILCYVDSSFVINYHSL